MFIACSFWLLGPESGIALSRRAVATSLLVAWHIARAHLRASCPTPSRTRPALPLVNIATAYHPEDYVMTGLSGVFLIAAQVYCFDLWCYSDMCYSSPM